MEDFVTYEQAVDLQRFGFDWKCNHYFKWNSLNPTEYIVSHESAYVNWNHENHQDFWLYSAPTLAQAQKWLREIKGVNITIGHVYHRLDTGDKIMYSLHIGNQSTFKTEFYLNYDSYEEALTEGIDRALQILTDKTEKK